MDAAIDNLAKWQVELIEQFNVPTMMLNDRDDLLEHTNFDLTRLYAKKDNTQMSYQA